MTSTVNKIKKEIDTHIHIFTNILTLQRKSTSAIRNNTDEPWRC
jgi:hypothetical protein